MNYKQAYEQLQAQYSKLLEQDKSLQGNVRELQAEKDKLCWWLNTVIAGYRFSAIMPANMVIDIKRYLQDIGEYKE